MLPAISREVTLLAPVTVTALPIHLGRLRFYLLLLLLTCTCEEAATATVMMMDDFEEEKYDQVTDARGTSGSSGASALDAKGLFRGSVYVAPNERDAASSCRRSRRFTAPRLPNDGRRRHKESPSACQCDGSCCI